MTPGARHVAIYRVLHEHFTEEVWPGAIDAAQVSDGASPEEIAQARELWDIVERATTRRERRHLEAAAAGWNPEVVEPICRQRGYQILTRARLKIAIAICNAWCYRPQELACQYELHRLNRELIRIYAAAQRHALLYGPGPYPGFLGRLVSQMMQKGDRYYVPIPRQWRWLWWAASEERG